MEEKDIFAALLSRRTPDQKILTIERKFIWRPGCHQTLPKAPNKLA
jgi:hypothetical protein